MPRRDIVIVHKPQKEDEGRQIVVENIQEMYTRIKGKRFLCFDVVITKDGKEQRARYASGSFGDDVTLDFELVDKYTTDINDNPVHQFALVFHRHAVYCYRTKMMDISDWAWGDLAGLCMNGKRVIKVLRHRWQVPTWVPFIGGNRMFPVLTTGLLDIGELRDEWQFFHPGLVNGNLRVHCFNTANSMVGSGLGIKFFIDTPLD